LAGVARGGYLIGASMVAFLFLGCLLSPLYAVSERLAMAIFRFVLPISFVVLRLAGYWLVTRREPREAGVRVFDTRMLALVTQTMPARPYRTSMLPIHEDRSAPSRTDPAIR